MPPQAGPDTLVLDTESRYLPSTEAAERVREALRAARGLGYEHFYKKTDSTLRGNIGTELQILLEETGVTDLPFVPAYPQAGRTIENGRLFVHGEPLERTDFASDPRSPIDTSLVAEALRGQCDASVISVRLQDDPTLPPRPAGRCIWIFDCKTPEDMEVIAEFCAARNWLNCCAGAAGLIRTIAHRNTKFHKTFPSVPSGPAVIINGSLTETSLRQCQQALDHGLVRGICVKTDDTKDCLAQCRKGQNVLLYSVLRRTDAPAAPSSTMAQHMGQWAANILAECDILPTLVVFGGETVLAVVEALGVTGLEPIGEFQPGVILMQARRQGDVLSLITKCGGFGDENLLRMILSKSEN
jgi:uncharacterized protein YgbK (DUF1537 family)